MTPSTISTILNSAPMMIQGASKLINLIREQGKRNTASEHPSQPTIEDLDARIKNLEARLDVSDEASIEQIKLIEQLARQNEVLAASVQRINRKLVFLAVLVIGIGLLALIALSTGMLK